MTAEPTLSPAGAQPPKRGFPPVSVLPLREVPHGLRPPAGQRRERRSAPALPLLAADAAAAAFVATELPHPLLAAPLLLAVVCLNVRAGLYRPPVVPAALEELPALCARITVSWCALAALVAACSPANSLSAHTLLTGCALQSAAGCAARGAVHWRRRRELVRHPAAALVIGPAATAQRVAAAFLRHPGCGIRPVGVVTDDAVGGGTLPVLTTAEEVQRAVIQNGVRALLVAGPAGRHGPLLTALAEPGRALWEVCSTGEKCRTAPTLSYEDGGRRARGLAGGVLHGTGHPSGPRIPYERMAGFHCRRLDVRRRHVSPGKRVLDVLVSGFLLLLLAPALVGCALVLRVGEGPGVLFRQERTGEGGRPFTLLKFRTHRPVDPHEAATRWTVAGARDMSPFCRFLRRTSLDELPQLWNVFRGDMSLVGPRPERPYFVAKFSQAHPGYADRHRMPTGLTGLAQIHGLRGDTSIEDRARFDNAYIDDWSLWQDVCILLRTAAALVRAPGS